MNTDFTTQNRIKAVSEVMVWIPTHGGTRYHSRSSCSNMDGPIQVTKSEAEAKGFTPCGKCYR